MKTTTTTTARAVIFSAAHAVTRIIRRDYAAADYRVTFAAALRECYAAARAAADVESISADSIAAAALAAPSARAEFDALTDEQKHALLVGMVWKLKKRDAAACDRRGNERAPRMAWIVSADDAEACANEAYTRLGDLFARFEVEQSDKGMKQIVGIAVMRAAQYIDRAERRHVSALRIESTTDSDGNETRREYIKDSESTAERIAPPPHEYAALTESVNDACRDSIDRDIMRGMIYGLKQREIAEYVGIKQQNVSKRIKGIRARYEDEKRGDTVTRGYGMRAAANAEKPAAADPVIETWTYRAPQYDAPRAAADA